MENTHENPFVGPHEIHVTVNPDSNPGHFRAACDALGVKPHIIYNEVPHGEGTTDLLTGSDYDTTTPRAFSELSLIVRGLEDYGLEVVRQKIETVPHHPAAPITQEQAGQPGTYFESHFVLPDLPTTHGNWGELLQWKGVPFYISTTEKKRQEGLLFATMRYYDTTAGVFCQTIDDLYGSLMAQLDIQRKPTVEYALYDSNPSHDEAWVNAYQQLAAQNRTQSV